MFFKCLVVQVVEVKVLFGPSYGPDQSISASVLGWCLFYKSDIDFMGIKSCALFTELGRIVVKSLVFYIGKSTPRPTHLGGKTMDREVFF